MASILNPLRPSSRRVQLPNCTSLFQNLQQTRHATLIKRPKRPYTFTQLVMLTDGSAFIHRTTSPLPVYRSNKDINNAPLWNPSSDKLANLEEDEAGKLSAFRSRFGRSWDQSAKKLEEATNETLEDTKQSKTESARKSDDGEGLDLLMDLISGSATNIPAPKVTSKPLKRKK